MVRATVHDAFGLHVSVRRGMVKLTRIAVEHVNGAKVNTMEVIVIGRMGMWTMRMSWVGARSAFDACPVQRGQSGLMVFVPIARMNMRSIGKIARIGPFVSVKLGMGVVAPSAATHVKAQTAKSILHTSVGRLVGSQRLKRLEAIWARNA